MTERHPVRLPVCDTDTAPADLLADVEGWVTSAPLRDLVHRFGGRLPAGTLDDVLTYLLDFSAVHWDFRGGRERADARRAVFDAETDAAILDAVHRLGLRGPTSPRLDRYDHVLVLGGLIRACLARTWYAAELLRTGITAPEVTAVGGFRVMAETERRLADALDAPGCHYETDCLVAGLRQAFGADTGSDVRAGGDPAEDPNRAWSVVTFRPPGAPVLRAVAAPSSEPELRRAHTGDSIRYWADDVVGLPRGAAVLVVTSPTFVPFQHCDAIRHIGLPYGCRVETVGLRTESLPPRLRVEPPDPDRYLQEVRSTIWSMRRLATAAATSTTAS
ncbi:hypothetical protein LX16_1047 [Stackebrandtia albiflava]|uniref:Uncharacterized protein n=1 Tax=Stackebrandtia albiflava TaxID=406432 RepID=A0A562VBU5_9ACTN|nr:hypothetical protein [Stackebrandtia albiflava]TWJ15346.1 hypothetical protein LX16_1047 [Stackebrandtia albiflava]